MAKAGKETAVVQNFYKVYPVFCHMKLMPQRTDDWKVSGST